MSKLGEATAMATSKFISGLTIFKQKTLTETLTFPPELPKRI